MRKEASNHLPGPWLKTVVLNGVGKDAAGSRQVWAGKMSDRPKAFCRLKRRKLMR